MLSVCTYSRHTLILNPPTHPCPHAHSRLRLPPRRRIACPAVATCAHGLAPSAYTSVRPRMCILVKSARTPSPCAREAHVFRLKDDITLQPPRYTASSVPLLPSHLSLVSMTAAKMAGLPPAPRSFFPSTSTDSRSPCPALNALANHSYLLVFPPPIPS